MLFSSVPFLFYFLPILLAVYAAAPGRAGKNAALLAGSLIFYAWGEPVFILVLLGSIGANHLLGQWIAGRSGSARGRVLALGAGVNLALLAAFKYAGFVFAQFAWAGAPQFETPLPLGLSFFTFQAISYLADIARKDAPPSASLAKTGLYIALFPQLIAGPIVRFKEISAQLEERRESWAGFAAGGELFILGLAQKVLLANTLAGPADAAFGHAPETLSLGLAWLGAGCYALQIYYDFAGYSNMALGLGLLFGLRLPRNFDHPYAAASFREFWRRWHMTLSAWFRDYVYVPLGGSRQGAWRTYSNLLIVFVLCGFWHGAAWTFVLWGLWHGAFLIAERAGAEATRFRPPRVAGVAYTCVFVTLGWVLFRADGLSHALGYWAAMAGMLPETGPRDTAAFHLSDDVQLALVFGVLLATPYPARWWGRAREAAQRQVWRTAALWTPLMAGFVLCAMAIAANAYDPFIYFRF